MKNAREKKKRIVITGMGVVSCFGNEVDHFYQQLLQGKSGVTPLTDPLLQEYPTRFAAQVPDFDPSPYIDKKQARRVDPFVRYAMVAGRKALEQAGLTGEAFEALDKARAGILIGSGMGGMRVFYDGVETLLSKGYKRLTPFFVPFIITNIAGALLAIDLGFMGPNYSISTACATANYSIHAAAEHILRGDADVMICGGSEAALTPIGVAGFVACKALSERNDAPEKASRPWDKNRDGFVMGEGAGVLVLESLEHAQKRGAPILAEYLGGAVSCDAHHMTDPRGDGLGVSMCIEGAIAQAGIDKAEINYINAHATSTLAGDLCEVRGIRNVFGDQVSKITMNGTKSMIGHCLGAAGGLEAVATIQAIITGEVHPTINLEMPEEEAALFDLPTTRKKMQITAALSNSFGFGGHNSSLLFAPYKASSC
ncbi:MAG: 3-oxoacyl-[acyl-carrier-protein] synthase I,chloroplastic [Chlamydiota bacterium]|jgi:3-oxoacyl-[acyl-carrier-protein] synthase II